MVALHQPLHQREEVELATWPELALYTVVVVVVAVIAVAAIAAVIAVAAIVLLLLLLSLLFIGCVHWLCSLVVFIGCFFSCRCCWWLLLFVCCCC